MKDRSRKNRALTALLFACTVCLLTAQAAGPVEFSMRSVDGRTITADGLRGKVVVLAFGASWLPLSRTQVQGVQRLADDYRGRGVEVFWVSTDSESPRSKNYASDEQLKEFARKYGLNVTVLRDPEGTISRRLGVDQLPAIVILDRAGNVAGAPIGGLDPKGDLVGQLASRLERLL
ncbi:MAG: hypothetical protein C4334_08715 [Pyrinomonas sp.]|uniref:peroxiredoxin family protein n=1 Tax=Pyrinomonas sp. TaxID=2080306 RepID=UPI003331108F